MRGRLGRRVIPIESLLHRIRWDEAFGGAASAIGYYDRTRQAVVTVPFEHIRLEHGNQCSD